ncbi:MAG: YbfB/YjiJ family MFS transporter [Sporomusaceae bacterium]|nr:YbfB/YjiJ family MFS transporter [Sporomusaceae bacterium]
MTKTDKGRNLSTLIGGICALSLAMGVARFGFTPIIPLMQRDTGATGWDIAAMASANYLGYLLGAYCSGRPWVRMHLRSWLGGGLAFSIFLLLAMPLTLNQLLWQFMRLGSGFLSAVLFVAASGIVLGQGRSGQARYLYSGVGVGIAFTGLAVPLFDAVGGWRAAWLGLALGGAFFGAVAWLTLAHTARSVAASTEAAQASDRFERDRSWCALLVSYGLEGIGYIITATFIVQMIGAMPALSHVANQSWVVIGLAAAPSAWMWDRLARKLGIQAGLVLAYGLQAVGMLLPVVIVHPASALAGGVLFGGTFIGITSLTITLACRLQPQAQIRAIGELTTIYALGQIIGPVVAAQLQMYAGIAAPSVFAAATLLLALLTLAALNGKRKGEDV